MDRGRPSTSNSEEKIPEAWIGQEVMIETTEVLSSDLRASAPVYLEDVNDRGVVMLVTRHRDQNEFSRYFYPWSVVGWIRLAEEDEREIPQLAAPHRRHAIHRSAWRNCLENRDTRRIRDSKAAKRGAKRPRSVASWSRRTVERPSAIFQTVSEGQFSEIPELEGRHPRNGYDVLYVCALQPRVGHEGQQH